MNPEDLRYTEEHEWVGKLGDQFFVGITDYAQAQLGDITYVELPEVDRPVDTGEELAVVESVKAASDVYAPLAGKVVEVNELLDAQPELVNKDPYGGGWFFKLEEVDATEFDALMDVSAYRTFVESCG